MYSLCPCVCVFVHGCWGVGICGCVYLEETARLIPLNLDITKHNNNVTDSTVQNVCVQKWALYQSIHLTWGTLGPRFSIRQLLMLGGWSQQAFPTVCGNEWVCWQDYCTEEKSPSRYMPAGHKRDGSFWTFTSSRCPAKQRGTGVRFMSVQQTLYADDNSQQVHTHTHTHILVCLYTHIPQVASVLHRLLSVITQLVWISLVSVW